MKTFLHTILLLLLFAFGTKAQDEYAARQFQFLSYGKVPTWTGVAAQWEKSAPTIHLYNSDQYRGHAEFVSKGLKTGITFKQFKEQVRHFSTRKYLPFFLFDARQHPIVIEGKTYTWALMPEDYAYEDTPEQMALTVLRLMQQVRAYISASSKAPGNNNGIIILSNNLKVKTNTSIAPLLNKNGFPHRSITELAALFEAPKTRVLNKGIAYGYLRYVPARGQDSVRLSPTDLVVYEKLPARVPPVGGIVTLEPQTPLSHINLLAKNRNTINLYTSSLQNIPGMAGLKNKLVKIECSEKKIMVSEARLEDAKKFWAGRLKKISIPFPVKNYLPVIDLSSSNKTLLDVPHIGAKASNYALIQASFPAYVRPGFAIPFHWYFHTLHQSGADSLVTLLVKQKNKWTVKERNLFLQKVRENILHTHLDTGLLHEVKRLGNFRFPSSRIRLRSSTNCEDLPEFNGAGLYLSKGYNVKDSLHLLEKKILQVYASLWSEAAFEEREFYFIDHTQAGMAILINEAFTNEYANGVVLTIPQKNGYSVFINTQAADQLVTNPENGQVPEAILFKTPTDTRYEIESRSSIKDLFLSPELSASLQELKKLSLEVQKVFDARQKNNLRQYGVDIEFRIMQEKEGFKLYIKQARLLRQTLPE